MGKDLVVRVKFVLQIRELRPFMTRELSSPNRLVERTAYLIADSQDK